MYKQTNKNWMKSTSVPGQWSEILGQELNTAQLGWYSRTSARIFQISICEGAEKRAKF